MTLVIDGSAAEIFQAIANLDVDPTNFNPLSEGVENATDIFIFEAINEPAPWWLSLTEINGTAADVAQALFDIDTDPETFNSVLTGFADAADITSIKEMAALKIP